MSLAAVAMAALMGWLDYTLQDRRVLGLDDLYLTGPEGARAVMATLAGSAISVTSVVFSITMVVLSMAAAQFGPRLLRNFMDHGGTQFVLGTFVATFIYCLLVLAMVRSEDGHSFVPQFAAAIGVLLGVISFGLLIYFIHHVSVFIQAPFVIADVGRRLDHALRKSFPESSADSDSGRDAGSGAAVDMPVPPNGSRPIRAHKSGYVQGIDLESLDGLACECDLMIWVQVRPGQYLLAGRTCAMVSGRQSEEAIDKAVRQALVLGSERTATQDPEFAVDQLVEIALRALSPGVNDPFTAINCIDRLGASLALLASLQAQSSIRFDDEGRARVVVDCFTHAGVIDAAFHKIRQCARDSPPVTLRLLEVINQLGRGDLPEHHRQTLQAQADAIHEASRERFASANDRLDLEQRYAAASEALRADPEAATPG
jgi:uncharacterized membrane protein